MSDKRSPRNSSEKCISAFYSKTGSDEREKNWTGPLYREHFELEDEMVVRSMQITLAIGCQERRI